ncbi:uncharacterized protein PG998_008540 [Apiospora kogelbergensis]|uniref:uncharacterized protein n=1 Tax=Apiospora kogelbergensis TaxID=1337665 RepID=UPI00312E93F7
MACNELEFYKLVGGFDEDEDEKEGETPDAAMADPTEENVAGPTTALAQRFEQMEIEGDGMNLD